MSQLVSPPPYRCCVRLEATPPAVPTLQVQMDLQTKLHRQLLVQRQLQHQLEHSFTAQRKLDTDSRPALETSGADAEATLMLKNNVRERLTMHVIKQQVPAPLL